MVKQESYQAQILACSDKAFRFAVQQFYWRLESRRRSPKTLRDYSYRLWEFSNFLQASNIAFEKVDKGVIRAFFAHLQQRPSGNPKRPHLASTTITGHWRALRVFFNFLVADGELWMQPNPIRPVDAPSAGKLTPKRVLQQDDIDNLLSIPNRKTLVGKRQTLLVFMLWETAARIGELLGVRVKDVDLQRGQISVDGKTGQRTIPITPEMKAKIDRYVRERGLTPHDFLLGTSTGRALPQRNARRILDGLFEQAKRKHSGRWPDDYKISPHALRHARLTFLAGRMDSIALRAIAGHSDLRTTLRYVHFSEVDNERLRDAFLKATQPDNVRQAG